MKNFTEFHKRFNHALQAFLLAAFMLSLSVCAATSTASVATPETPQYMFV